MEFLNYIPPVVWWIIIFIVAIGFGLVLKYFTKKTGVKTDDIQVIIDDVKDVAEQELQKEVKNALANELNPKEKKKSNLSAKNGYLTVITILIFIITSIIINSCTTAQLTEAADFSFEILKKFTTNKEMAADTTALDSIIITYESCIWKELPDTVFLKNKNSGYYDKVIEKDNFIIRRFVYIDEFGIPTRTYMIQPKKKTVYFYRRK